MKLINLELDNFRQHLHSSIQFMDGLTGIIGSNGAGKTTILEAIAWALYGAPAVRGTNDTIRSKASEGGAKASAALAFELNGSIYKVTRTLDASGKTGHAFLDIDGKTLRSGTTEVNAAISKLLGMDYHAFFTSFFTGQKSLEFMAALEGRARAAAISRMLGYDRLTKARDQANQDKLGLQREIDGLEKGLPDPEELKERKKEAKTKLSEADRLLKEAETTHKSAEDILAKLKPLKEASDQKAKRSEEISHRLEVDSAEVSRSEKRLAELNSEIAALKVKQQEFSELKQKLAGFRDIAEEYKKMSELSKYEGDRQRLNGQISTLEQDIKRLQASERQLSGADDIQMRASIALSEAETLLSDTDKKIQSCREERLAGLHTLDANIKQLESHRKELAAKRQRIEDAGSEGKCPTCERPLADELPKVLSNFDSQLSQNESELNLLKSEKQKLESDNSEIQSLTESRQSISDQIKDLKSEKSKSDAKVVELNTVRKDMEIRSNQIQDLKKQLSKLPSGYDAERFKKLTDIKESLLPIRERAAGLNGELERAPRVENDALELSRQLEIKKQQVSQAEQVIKELAFSPDTHEKLSQDYDNAQNAFNMAAVQLERQRGELNTAEAIVKQIEREEDNLKIKLGELKEKRSERLHLQTLAEAFDRLRAELNDRIRPELESIASDLIDGLTDGRYNCLEINDSYQAMIRDDGELKPVISGGEDDIVNLALRLAISQMIADRAGQSFSLLILDEVFGSLDDARRDNVVSLLQNLKNRFEQIIIITHVESIHDAVDNCIWVEFDEKTKTSRLTDRSEQTLQPAVGTLL